MKLKLKEIYTDSTGRDWLPIKQQGDYWLLVTRDVVLRGTPYNKCGIWRKFNSASCIDKLVMWMLDNLADEIARFGVPADLSDYEVSKPSENGNYTNRLFPLSKTEAFDLMSEEERSASEKDRSDHRYTWWWLRSSCFTANSSASVDSNGSGFANNADNTSTNHAFRPAIWVHLPSEISDSDDETERKIEIAVDDLLLMRKKRNNLFSQIEQLKKIKEDCIDKSLDDPTGYSPQIVSGFDEYWGSSVNIDSGAIQIVIYHYESELKEVEQWFEGVKIYHTKSGVTNDGNSSN